MPVGMQTLSYSMQWRLFRRVTREFLQGRIPLTGHGGYIRLLNRNIWWLHDSQSRAWMHQHNVQSVHLACQRDLDHLIRRGLRSFEHTISAWDIQQYVVLRLWQHYRQFNQLRCSHCQPLRWLYRDRNRLTEPNRPELPSLLRLLAGLGRYLASSRPVHYDYRICWVTWWRFCESK